MALKIVWCGDLNNVLFSLLESMKFLVSSKIDIFTDKKIYEKNHHNFPKLDNISYHFEIDDKILESADCVMTDVFNSMNDKDDKEKYIDFKKIYGKSRINEKNI